MTKEDLSNYTFSKNNLTTSYEGTKLIEGIPVQSTDTVGIQDIQKNLSDYTFDKDTDVEIRNDFIAFDEVSLLLESEGLSNEMIKTNG